MFEKLRNYIRLFWKESKSLFAEMLPKNRMEKSVLIASLCLYLPIVISLVIKTNLLWSLIYYFDVCFDFDSCRYITLLTSFRGWGMSFSHPLIVFLRIPFRIIGYLFFILAGAKARFYFILLIFPVLVSFTNVFVFRYLKNIARISLKRALLLTAFFAFFATNLTLSFTPESFPFSLFLLSFMITAFSGLMLAKRKIPFFQLFILSFLIGGTTVTNIVKCFIPDLFLKSGFKYNAKRIFVITSSLLCLYLLISIKNIKEDKIDFSADQYKKYSGALNCNPEYLTTTSNALFSYFWSAPFVWGDLSDTSLREKKYYEENNPPRLNILPYTVSSDYVFGIVLLLLCIISGWLNHKNKLVYILILCFAVDLFIAGVLKYGLYNSFIFGGHWVFIIPMLLGWMYPGLKNNRQRTIFDVVMVGMFIALLINNTYRMSQIFDFALKYYPA